LKNLSAIILLFIANSISGIAQGISMIAIPWYFKMEDSMSLFGWIYIATNIVSFFWVPFSGTCIDRYNRRNIFLYITIVSGLIVTSIALLGYYWGVLPWYWVALVFMMTFFNYNIHYPNLYAFVQEITEKKYFGNIASYIEIQGQLSSVLAGAGAALLLEGTTDGLLNVFGFEIGVPFNIQAWSIYEIFMLDAGTYFVAFVVISFIRFEPLKSRTKEIGNSWTQLKSGYHFLKNNTTIFLFGTASYCVFLSVLLTTFYLAAVYVDNHLHEQGDVYATCEMFYAVGAVLAGIAIRWVFKKVRLPMAVIIMTLLTSALFLVLAVTQDVWIFYGMLFLLGLTNAGTRIMRTIYLMTNIPNQLYGRASSIFFLLNIVGRVFFLAIFSTYFFQSSNHVIYAFAIISGFLLLAALVLIRYYPAFVKNTPRQTEP